MELCYACANPATSREHVPPKCLFPEQKDAAGGADFRHNLITVPSCADHNFRKSRDDEYFLYVLVTTITSNQTALEHFQTKLARTIIRRPALANTIVKSGKECHIVDSANGKTHNAVQVDLDGERFQNTLELIARGIFYHHFKKRWMGGLRTHADWIVFPSELNSAEIDANRVALANSVDALLANVPKQASSPNVFWYQVGELPPLRCLIRLGFYGGSKATAFFGDIDILNKQPDF
ncbi:MAG: hypothetical protein K8R92_07215 [Planctomycetes bacterium]|nr:hypothetical protein [Planctomycetota bacterium]